MTTIVATREAIGADTMVTVDGQAPYRTQKVIRARGVLFGAAGDGGDCIRLMEWAKTGFDIERRPKFRCKSGHIDEALLLMVDFKGIYFLSAWDFFPEPVEEEFYAIGTGAGAALGALEKAATIEEALRIAEKHDAMTRGPFTILKLKEDK